MAKGDLINYTNLKSMLNPSVYRCSYQQGSAYTGNYTAYIISPSWWVQFYAGVWGIASIDGGYSVSQYEPSSNSWKTVYSIALSARNNSSNKNKYAYYYHNYNGSRTTNDNPREHLFKIVSGATWTQGNASWRTVNKTMYVGGTEHMTEAHFNEVCKYDAQGNPKPIKGLKPMIYLVGTGTDTANYSFLPSEQAIIDLYIGNPLRGTPIAVDSGTFKYCC